MTGSQKKGSLELAQWFDGLNDDPSLALPGRRPVGSSAADRTDCEVSMADSAPTSLTTGEAGEDGPQRPRRGIQRLHCSAAEAARMAREASLDIVTMSHFLPHQCLLPEKRFLIYPSFAKMSGSAPLGSRVASIEPAVHVFGHTHFSWDTTDTVSGTRFVQAPLSTPAEREGRPGEYGGSARGFAGRSVRQLSSG